MRNLALLTAITAATLVAVPATAATTVYNAANSFGTANSAFSYGAFDGTTLTAFTTEIGTCGIAALSCQLSSTEQYLGVYKNTGAAVTFATVNLPANALYMHPGATTSQAYMLFTAPTTGTYDLTSTFSLLDFSGVTGTKISTYLASSGTLDQINLVSLGSKVKSTGLTTSFDLLAGEGVLFALGNGGNYTYDSTQFDVSLSTTAAVPEAATWAMMLIGFGAVGGATRYRRRKTTVAFA